MWGLLDERDTDVGGGHPQLAVKRVKTATGLLQATVQLTFISLGEEGGNIASLPRSFTALYLALIIHVPEEKLGARCEVHNFIHLVQYWGNIFTWGCLVILYHSVTSVGEWQVPNNLPTAHCATHHPLISFQCPRAPFLHFHFLNTHLKMNSPTLLYLQLICMQLSGWAIFFFSVVIYNCRKTHNCLLSSLAEETNILEVILSLCLLIYYNRGKCLVKATLETMFRKSHVMTFCFKWTLFTAGESPRRLL